MSQVWHYYNAFDGISKEKGFEDSNSNDSSNVTAFDNIETNASSGNINDKQNEEEALVIAGLEEKIELLPAHSNNSVLDINSHNKGALETLLSLRDNNAKELNKKVVIIIAKAKIICTTI